ncbi:MAG TPA: amino acid ABC transporter substrate-binding protein, partial [Paracoccaceae bacterium]|nr:amino acid ABC transporter substrate-binding protein [Paracoccaceae bacterium]
MILRLATFLALALAYGGPAAARCENVAPEAKPQNIGRDVVGQNLDEIRERGFVTFAVYEDFPPWSWEEGGRLL